MAIDQYHGEQYVHSHHVLFTATLTKKITKNYHSRLEGKTKPIKPIHPFWNKWTTNSPQNGNDTIH